jgi:predicted transcriptional regulator
MCTQVGPNWSERKRKKGVRCLGMANSAEIESRFRTGETLINRDEITARDPMAEPVSIFDLLDGEAEERALAEAQADFAAGRVVSHEEVSRWLNSWGKPDELPCPVPGFW